jgi:hypothetical protein
LEIDIAADICSEVYPSAINFSVSICRTVNFRVFLLFIIRHLFFSSIQKLLPWPNSDSKPTCPFTRRVFGFAGWLATCFHMRFVSLNLALSPKFVHASQ